MVVAAAAAVAGGRGDIRDRVRGGREVSGVSGGDDGWLFFSVVTACVMIVVLCRVCQSVDRYGRSTFAQHTPRHNTTKRKHEKKKHEKKKT
jgi:hypothetical protein